jgi:hypothetical protein
MVQGSHQWMAGFPFLGSPRRWSPHTVRAFNGRHHPRRHPLRPRGSVSCAVDLQGGFLVRPCGLRLVSVSLLLLGPLLTSPRGSGSMTLPSALADGPWEPSRGKTQSFPRVGAGVIQHAPIAAGGLPGHVPTRPERATPHLQCRCVATRLGIGLPPDPTSRWTPVPFASPSAPRTPGARTFTALVLCHARHTRPRSAAAKRRQRFGRPLHCLVRLSLANQAMTAMALRTRGACYDALASDCGCVARGS